MILLGTEKGKITEKTFTVSDVLATVAAKPKTLWRTLTAEQKMCFIRGAYALIVGEDFTPTEEWQRVGRKIRSFLSGEYGKKNWLLLTGGVGTGKTVWAKALCEFYRQANYLGNGRCNGFYSTTANKMADMARLDEVDFYHYSSVPRMFIDDIGTEPELINVFGTKKNPITDLLLVRYEKNLPTIITTNLLPKQLAERYGVRVADRLRGQSVLVEFTADSFRH